VRILNSAVFNFGTTVLATRVSLRDAAQVSSAGLRIIGSDSLRETSRSNVSCAELDCVGRSGTTLPSSSPPRQFVETNPVTSEAGFERGQVEAPQIRDCVHVEARELFFRDFADPLIALFPMPWTGKLAPLYWVHGTAAIIFFLAIASVAAFCSQATVRLINDPTQRKVYMGAYGFLAVLMITSPIAACVLNAHILRRDNAIYVSGPVREKKVAAGVSYDPPKLHIVASVKSMLSGGTSTTIPTHPSP
jgi:hypothetical protein